MSKTVNEVELSNRWGSNKRWVHPDEAQKAILDAAVLCFEKKGMRSTTIEEIAQTANITRRTVYHYFKTKKEILEAAVDQHACNVINKMKEDVASSSDFSDYIVDCICYMVETMPQEPFYKLQVSENPGMQASCFYFTSGRAQNIWVDAFQQPYIEALRQRKINPQLQLQDILIWIGRIVLSYLQYPLPSKVQGSLKKEVELLFVNALKYGA